MNKKNVAVFGCVALFGVIAMLPADVFAQGLQNIGELETPVNKILSVIRTLAYVGGALALVWAGAEMVIGQSGDIKAIWAKIQGLAFGLLLLWGATYIVQGLVSLVG